MAFTGLWEGLKWLDGAVLRASTIVPNANALMEERHGRMPVIFELDDWPT
jgi:putative SOS response-associated peptidase YedK